MNNLATGDFPRFEQLCDEPIAKNEWQLCPKCDGKGEIWQYPAHNSTLIFTSSVYCDLCNGRKIISRQTGLPPQ